MATGNQRNTLIVLTAGRESELDITIKSIEKNLFGNFYEKIIFDNSDGDKIKRQGFKTIKIPGFGLSYSELRHSKAIEFMFSHIQTLDCDNFVFFEEDWELNIPVDVNFLCSYLNADVSQIRLFRTRTYDSQEIFKNIFLVKKSKYMFSWNPCIFKKNIVYLEYPVAANHEFLFGEMINKPFLVYNPGAPVVSHVGYNSISKDVVWDKDYAFKPKDTDHK